ncbi:hypothetical protein KAM360_12820 [Aeromonas caviae]|nr:hypothetical protein KAM360_12820 [Aeromonas caviae]
MHGESITCSGYHLHRLITTQLANAYLMRSPVICGKKPAMPLQQAFKRQLLIAANCIHNHRGQSLGSN